jgi:hypothetical protein
MLERITISYSSLIHLKILDTLRYKFAMIFQQYEVGYSSIIEADAH